MPLTAFLRPLQDYGKDGRDIPRERHTFTVNRNADHETFLERFLKPHPTHFSMTVPVEGSGLMANLTPRKSLMCLKASIP